MKLHDEQGSLISINSVEYVQRRGDWIYIGFRRREMAFCYDTSDTSLIENDIKRIDTHLN